MDVQYSISAGVPQGSDLSPLVYTIYTSDLPISENTIVGIYADDIDLLSAFSDHTIEPPIPVFKDLELKQKNKK